jgi:K+-transporting ATPase ATPase A chain
VGRTPEYLGKKIEQKVVKMVMLAALVLAFTILGFSAVGAVIHFPHNSWVNAPGDATANLGNNGPHGLTEMLYAYTSAVGNNGSAFAGINANTPYFNTTIGIAMLFGRFLMMIPLLAAAGSLAQKKLVPVSAGTFPTHGPLFVGLLVGVIVIVGALTFFPALSLGPVVEHFFMNAGRLWS